MISASSLDDILDIDNDETDSVESQFPVGSKQAIEGTQKCGTLYFDLETVPDWTQAARIGIEPLPEPPAETPLEDLPSPAELIDCTIPAFTNSLEAINPPADYFEALKTAEGERDKPRDGIIKAIDKRIEKGSQAAIARDEQRKKLATCPELCRIVALGIGVNGIAWPFVVGCNEATEAQLLRLFWNAAKEARQVCGYNILRFDLPVIFARSILLEVPSSRTFSTKPWENEVLDLYARRFPKGNQSSPGKLKEIAQLYGIKVPAGDFEGSQVEAVYDSGDFDSIARYVASDVLITSQLHKRLSGYFV